MTESTEGTPRGAVISPLLANIYLHYVYDLWVDQCKRPVRSAQAVAAMFQGSSSPMRLIG